MKRNYLIIFISLIALISINLILFRSIYKFQINQQKNLLLKETEVCSQEIERVVSRFESDLNYILYSDDIKNIFSEKQSEGLRKIQLFYSTYHNLIKNIDIYDNEKHVMNVFRDKKKNFLTDNYEGQRQRSLVNKDEVIIHKSNYQYILPVFKDNEVFANVLVTINLNNYILSELKKFHLEGFTWQWVADLDNQKIYNAQGVNFTHFQDSETIIKDLFKDRQGLKIHVVENDSLEYKLLTVYSPIKVLKKNFGIAMSVNYKILLQKIFGKLYIIAASTILIFILVSLFLVNQILILKKKIKI